MILAQLDGHQKPESSRQIKSFSFGLHDATPPALLANVPLPRSQISSKLYSIHGLDAELAALEEQYGLLSADFYHCYRAGELEQTRDFIRWAGFYEAKQEREGQYRQLVYEHLRKLRRRSGLGALALDPAGA